VFTFNMRVLLHPLQLVQRRGSLVQALEYWVVRAWGLCRKMLAGRARAGIAAPTLANSFRLQRAVERVLHRAEAAGCGCARAVSGTGRRRRRTLRRRRWR
jgi:hypothetical protein